MTVDGYGAPTVVRGSAGELAVMWGGFPLLGAGAGWLLTPAAGWIAELPWVPAQGLFDLVARLPEPQATLGGVALGVLAGLVVAGIGTVERLTVSVDPERVRLHRDGKAQEVARRTVRVAFLSGKDLVLLGADDEELAREPSDLDAARLGAAFRAHGYPWSDEDPHRDAYRLWVPDLPGLPAGADALLRARHRAIERDREGDARELRGELARLGVVVRDGQKRQYWRLTRSAPPPGSPQGSTSATGERNDDR